MRNLWNLWKLWNFVKSVKNISQGSPAYASGEPLGFIIKNLDKYYLMVSQKKETTHT